MLEYSYISLNNNAISMRFAKSSKSLKQYFKRIIPQATRRSEGLAVDQAINLFNKGIATFQVNKEANKVSLLLPKAIVNLDMDSCNMQVKENNYVVLHKHMATKAKESLNPVYIISKPRLAELWHSLSLLMPAAEAYNIVNPENQYDSRVMYLLKQLLVTEED